MTRAQALTFSMLFAFVILGLTGMAILLIFPYNQVFGPTPTASYTTTPSPTFTRTPILPTLSLITPTPPEPTPSNTPVPTLTPTQPLPPTATVNLRLPTPYVRPSSTPTLPPAAPLLTSTPTPTLLPGRGYSISFSSRQTQLNDGDCTQLEWQVTGQAQVWLAGEPVATSGRQRICPNRTTDYRLTVQRADTARQEQRLLTIEVN